MMVYDEDVMNTIRKIYHPRIIKTMTPSIKPPIKPETFKEAYELYEYESHRNRCFRNRMFITLKCFEEECPYLEYKNEAECVCTFFKREKTKKKKKYNITPAMYIEDAIISLKLECEQSKRHPDHVVLNPVTFDTFMDYLKNQLQYSLGKTKYGHQVMFVGLTIYADIVVPVDEVRLYDDGVVLYRRRIQI